jgi:hypothetical protein
MTATQPLCVQCPEDAHGMLIFLGERTPVPEAT